MKIDKRRPQSLKYPEPNNNLQGLDPKAVWTKEYVDNLAFNMKKIHKNRSGIDRMEKYLSDCTEILDVGCGWMPFKLDNRYTGCDISETMLHRARQLHPKTQFIRCSAYYLPFKDNSFDGVRSSGMLRHMKEWRPALQEMIRIARRKLAFSHLVGFKEQQCGKYQWCTTFQEILKELPSKSEPQIWIIRSWPNFNSILFRVEICK